MCAVQLLRVSVHERISAAAEDFLLQLEKGEEAAELPALRALLTERLTAAAEEIVGLLEETVAEYEERVERSEREICRQRRLLDAVLKPEVRLHRADVQQLLVRNEDQNQENHEEPPNIKEEQEELWSIQEAEITKFSPDSVKSEEDEEKPQSSPFHLRDSEPEPEASELSVAEIEVSCDDWEENNEAPSGFSEAKGNSPEKLLGCTDYGKTFPNKDREKPFSCSVCGKKYSKKSFLLQHMAVHRGERRQYCSVCNKQFLWQAGVECHQCVGGASQYPAGGETRCNKPLNVSECDKRLCYSHHLKKNMGVFATENLFTCSVCGRRFTQRGYLMQHMDRHTGKIRFRCCICDKRFAWRHDLKNHKCGDLSQSSFGNGNGGPEPVASNGSDTDDKTSDSSDPEAEGDDVCKEPQKELNSAADSGVGGNTHQKSFICSECGKTFCGDDNIKMHMKTHAGEKPFSCSFCDKGLTQTRHLTNHSSAHSEEKRFLYCVCGKRFAWCYNLKNSESLHTESEPAGGNSNTSDSTDVSADHCQKMSSGLNNNNTAEEDVGSDMTERRFSCSQCSKRFRHKKNLQEHLRIHTGAKPYGCSVCMKCFSCSGSLRKHMRIHTGERPFSCSVCGNRFTESGHLKVHMRTHTGEKPFSCSVCGKSFTWRQSFNNHMKCHSETKRDVN